MDSNILRWLLEPQKIVKAKLAWAGVMALRKGRASEEGEIGV
jgi:hypothetical protein